MNVAYHLQKLGMHTSVITRVGKDKWGDDLKMLLQQQGIATGEVQVDEVHSTGLVNATLKENNEVAYDIVFPVAWDFIGWKETFSTLVQQAAYFVFGSLAARNDVSRNTLFQLLQAANKKVLDINLRPPHFNRKSLTELLQQADILKLNDHEVKLISGWFGDYHAIDDQVRRVQEEFSMDTILVTRGSEGALICQSGELFHHKGYKVTVADTVGSGDAFLAGYLYKTANGSEPADALAFANALGAFIATQAGACPEYDVTSVSKIMRAEQ
ncbi:MAG TPA: PfkB family carbohydrate kinase, partial [Flavisolibacter sp.]|nr:PfkB family carbohydrate kinase [Flavisolibacter sp.]